MGKVNDVLHHYLNDAERFADLYNGIFFAGKAIIDARELTEAEESYYSVPLQEISETKGMVKHGWRSRDLKKYLKSGSTLRILAVENQNQVDYSMPFRCMEYDALEYRKQLEKLKKKNEKEGLFESSAEWLCKIKKSDRLFPVYTLCLYHGEAPWDGPKNLKDMMDFEEADEMQSFFADYPMRLYCIDDETDFSIFHTEIKELFTIMQYRKSKKQLQRILEENEAFKHLSGDTADAIAAVVDLPLKWRNKEMYRNDCGEKEEYNMCQALQEWAEDERNAGIKEGIKEGKIRLIEKVCKKMRKGKSVLVIADELEEEDALIAQICKVAEKYEAEYDYEKIYEELYSVGQV